MAINASLWSQKMTIAAASDMRSALTEIVTCFKKENPKVQVDIIYGSSGNLYQQITNKAPFDIYFSADNVYPEKLKSQKLISGKPEIYAIGKLVLWSATKDVKKGIELLKTSGIKRVAIANPEHAPYGKKAMECLKYYNLDELIKDKIVRGDNVSQAAQFVLTGNADVGIIALSLALSSEMMGKGKYIIFD